MFSDSTQPTPRDIEQTRDALAPELIHGEAISLATDQALYSPTEIAINPHLEVVAEITIADEQGEPRTAIVTKGKDYFMVGGLMTDRDGNTKATNNVFLLEPGVTHSLVGEHGNLWPGVQIGSAAEQVALTISDDEYHDLQVRDQTEKGTAVAGVVLARYYKAESTASSAEFTERKQAISEQVGHDAVAGAGVELQDVKEQERIIGALSHSADMLASGAFEPSVVAGNIQRTLTTLSETDPRRAELEKLLTGFIDEYGKAPDPMVVAKTGRAIKRLLRQPPKP